MEQEFVLRAIGLAQQILTLSRNSLFVNLRFLENALGRFDLKLYPGTIGTDGVYIYYQPFHILKRYKEAEKMVVHDFLHMVLHCVYRHSFVSFSVDHDLWDLSCDIAVESLILEFSLNIIDNERVHEKQTVLNELQKDLRLITAERVMGYLQDKNDPKLVQEWTKIFHTDDHEMWYQPPIVMMNIIGSLSKLGDAMTGGGDGSDGGDQGDENGDGQNGGGSEGPDGGGGDSPDGGGGSADQESLSGWLEKRKQLSEMWRDISQQIQKAFESFSQQIGNSPGSLVESLKELNRERYDYTAFLKKFAVMGETMRIDQDEFDYNFYSYGLQLYGNVALIEPLEYREEKRIREFVIAIDTSGSVHGQLVQKFLTKTYNIMKSTDSFFSKVNVWIIQCDADIQDAVQITNQDEFDLYIRDLELKGFGGTDFRPVFQFVNKMIAEKKFTNLKGLIYFTDGYGMYPDDPQKAVDAQYPNCRPKYETAFVFMRSDYESGPPPVVPPWAIKLILEDEDLESTPLL